MEKLSFKSAIEGVTTFIGDTVVNLLLTVATAAFMFSVVMFMVNRSRGNVEAMEDAKNKLAWSIVGLFVMFSIWGIINFFQEGFGIQNSNQISAPQVREN